MKQYSFDANESLPFFFHFCGVETLVKLIKIIWLNLNSKPENFP
jgi:hypothetical protein